jgi:HK97 family phage portal protein
MRFLGLEINRAKALQPVTGWRAGWRVITESFAGAWQQNKEVTVGDLSCYPTLYACLNRISQDIGKLPYVLKQLDDNGIWNTVTANSPFWPVLRKPNNYQTGQQFREAWILSKLINGNTYVLKMRDARGIVTRLYVLDPCRVIPMIADNGDIYYQLNYSNSQNLLPLDYPGKQIIVPASEIIHDRLNTFHHQLIGVPPLCAAYWPAAKNLNILKNAAQFFANNSQPGGILTAPAGMSEEDANKVKAFWQENYSGENRGKIALLGADMKFTSFAVNGADSQLVEQMQYSDRQICQPFGIPPYIVGVGEIPAGLKVDDVTNTYYSLALQAHIEAMEYLLDDGLAIPSPLGVEADTEPLLRMDDGKKADVATKLVGGGIETPNEGRRRFNRSPLEGGDTVYMQQQDYPLDQVRQNKIAKPTPPPASVPPAPPAPDNQNTADDENKRLNAEIWQLKAIQATREAVHA